MALFGRKKLTLDEILKGIDELPEEEKAKVKAKMEDVDKAEDEREIDKVEEEKADTPEIADEKAEEVKEESEEIGKDVDEVKEEVAEGKPAEPTEETPIEPVDTNTDDEPVEEPTEPETEAPEELDRVEEENAEDVNAGLADRISALEEFVAKVDLDKLNDLMGKLEEINNKHKDEIGYKGDIPNGKKSYSEMNADELEKELAYEI